MKKLLTIFAAIAAVFSAQAQWVSRPTPQAALAVSSGTYAILNGSATNVLFPNSPVVAVGANGFGISGTFGSTNSVTNGTTLVLEYIADVQYGTNAVSSGANQTNTISIVIPVVGTTPFRFWQSIPSAAGLQNLPGLRVKSFTPTNAATVWVTNLHIWSR